ncbi:MAG: sulfite exporter TauE/SafE family protein, partial [Deltaproteobacteria bacterium]
LDTAVKLAFGTNLLVVVPTAISGSLAHHRKGAVWWRAGLTLGITVAIGALVGSTITSRFISGKVIKVIFGLVILAGALRMLTAKPPKVEEEPTESPLLWALWGFPLGIVSGLIGIGGGVLMVPVMTIFLRFKMHRAIGTSTAMMIFSGLGGTIGYILNGLHAPGLPPHSIGYFNLPAWLCLAITSVIMAQLGARTAHLLPAKKLKVIFVLVMIYMAFKMIGVFEWLHLPL